MHGHGELDAFLDAVPLAAKVAFLARAASHGAHVSAVEVRETHMSFVFLAGGSAYKLKKPLRYRSIDYRTREARRTSCANETTLNRRLAPDVYRDALPLALAPSGGLAIGGAGPPVDWLVHMRRLADADCLEQALPAGRVGNADVVRLGTVLGAFFAAAAPRRVDDYRERLALLVGDCALELERAFARSAPAAAHPSIALPARALLAFLERHGDRFTARAREGRIVDGHGDLRAEHVYFEPAPTGARPIVIDCLEFDARLRELDPLDELASLDMECTRLGAEWVGPRVLAAYAACTGDVPDPDLVAFHAASRALLRACFAAWHFDDPCCTAPQRWIDRTAGYLALAHGYAARLTA